MHQILIPTDFSKNAWNAMVYAFQFFKDKKTTFHFLHIDISMQVNCDEDLHYDGLSIKKEIAEETKSNMEAWIQKIDTYTFNSNHNYKGKIVQSPFIEGIREYVVKMDIDFIVMGTKGASGLKEMTIGTKTSAVITRVKCPILVIPEEAIFKKPINIGFPTDFNILYKERILNTLLEITNTHQSSVKVLRVARSEKSLDNFQNMNRDLLKQSLNNIPYSFHVIENPDLEKALQSFVNIMQIDMVAMIAKNLNFFQRLLFKPQVAQISYHMQIPFLVLHE